MKILRCFYSVLYYKTFKKKILFYDNLDEKNWSNNQKESENNFKVAILTPISHPALEDIQKGFCDYLLKYIKVNFQ